MRFGLSEIQFKQLSEMIIEPLKSYRCRVYVFGSRATNSHHPFSDIDLLIESAASVDLPEVFLAELRERIEDSNFPLKLELVRASELARSYRERVDREKIEL